MLLFCTPAVARDVTAVRSSPYMTSNRLWPSYNLSSKFARVVGVAQIVHGPPFDVKDTVPCDLGYRSKDTAADTAWVSRAARVFFGRRSSQYGKTVSLWVGHGRQTLVKAASGRELGIAVGRQIDLG